jgi:predicted nuclease with TOPRIM domain
MHVENFLRELKGVQERLNRLRTETTGDRLEKAARKAGKDLDEYVDSELKRMEMALDQVQNGLRRDAYEFPGRMREHLHEIKESVEEVQEEMREARREVTGGTLGDGLEGMMEAVSEKLDSLVEGLTGKK